jgi:UDP-2,4-diacetamido-2,4,6-trideoxy-beta-L-altropyranose hydrolase
MGKPKIIFRADGGAKIGMGHFIRTLALVEMLRDGYHCIYATINPSPYQKEEIEKSCHDLIELPENEDHYQVFLSYLNGDEIVILDNYYFDTDYQIKIKKKGCKLVCIDDMHDKHYVADLVINHTPSNPSLFSCAIYTRLKLGFDYVLLRKHFLTNGLSKRNIDFKHVLIGFGGADINNLTNRILVDLLKIDNIERVDILIGDAFNYFDELYKNVANSSSTKKITIHKDLNSKSLVEIINNVDFAIVPASTILLEIISQDVPVITGYCVNNQIDLAGSLNKKYPKVLVVDNLNELLLDKAKIESLRSMTSDTVNERNERIIDGESPKRIVKEFNYLSKEFQIQTRKAKQDDVKLYFDWANDEAVRNFSVNKAELAFEGHSSWFTSKLLSADTVMYVFEESKNTIGQVRFDKKGEDIYISYSIDKKHRGRGFGKIVLKLALEKILNENIIKNSSYITGIVQLENEASIKVFKELNFISTNFEIHNGDKYYVFKKAM